MAPLENETELHYRVVQFIRNYFPEAVIVAGLGELQDTSPRRRDAYFKGYTSGQCDIILLSRTEEFSGLAIELKTPKGWGHVSATQSKFLKRARAQGFDTLVSCCYEETLVRITEHRCAALQYAELKLEGA
jgi:hypothetical protein